MAQWASECAGMTILEKTWLYGTVPHQFGSHPQFQGRYPEPNLASYAVPNTTGQGKQ